MLYPAKGLFKTLWRLSMKNIQIVALVLGTGLVTFILSVVFSINMVSISPKNLAKVIKEDPETFIEAIKSAGEEHRKQSEEKAMEDQFKNPKDIPTKGRVVFGDPSAEVTIVEYSDFQCPYCQRAAHSMKALITKYEGKVKLVYKHFPLSFHPFAQPAAEYFEAIALISHDKARQFHDSIFEDFSDYAKLQEEKEIKKSLKELVKKVGADMKTVQDNMEKAQKLVAEDMEEAKKFNVRGTPSFFVNGVNARGRIEMVVEKFLEKNGKDKEEE